MHLGLPRKPEGPSRPIQPDLDQELSARRPSLGQWWRLVKQARLELAVKQRASGLKLREPRQKVMIKARMRDGACWNDALILNMSRRGLMVRSDRSPGRGAFLEIRRGAHVIVARVIWSGADRFGVQTQDPVPTNELVADSAAPAAGRGKAESGCHDRRANRRSAREHHESSRQWGRGAEFAAMALAWGLAAVLIASIIGELVAKPIEAAQQALAAR
jgi:hypothetical protein